MRHNETSPTANSDLAHYFSKVELPTEQETLGQIVVEILRAGKQLNRKSICTKLLARFEASTTPEQERHHQKLIALLFGR